MILLWKLIHSQLLYLDCHTLKIIGLKTRMKDKADMEKGADTRTLSAEIFENCGNFWIVEYQWLLFWNKTNELWKNFLKYWIFGIFVAYESINLDTCESFEKFAEISNMNKTCPRKDWNFFHVWGYFAINWYLLRFMWVIKKSYCIM